MPQPKSKGLGTPSKTGGMAYGQYDQNTLRELARLSRIEHQRSSQKSTEVRNIIENNGKLQQEKTPSNRERIISNRGGSSGEDPRLQVASFIEFVCTAKDSLECGKNEVLLLGSQCDLQEIKDHVKEVFHLERDLVISIPEDCMSQEIEQHVLSSKHLQGLLDHFNHNRSTRRIQKVLHSALSIGNCLSSHLNSGMALEGIDDVVLSLNQLFELSQVPGNLETMDNAGMLDDLIVTVGALVWHGAVPTATAACRTAWRWAGSAGMRRRLVEDDLHLGLWGLLEKILGAVESSAQRSHYLAHKNTVSSKNPLLGCADPASRSGESLNDGDGKSFPPQVSLGSRAGDGAGSQTPGPELDNLTIHCLGVLSALLVLDRAKEPLTEPGHPGMWILLELATGVDQGCSIGDDKISCLAAESLALILNSNGGCRVAWVHQGGFPGILKLLRSTIRCVVLCAVSITNAFMRNETDRALLSHEDGLHTIEAAAPLCQGCLDELRPYINQG
ncbi:unnamed protein product, partial [Discosporangium mesarthrocarpum]